MSEPVNKKIKTAAESKGPDVAQIKSHVDSEWDKTMFNVLQDYIRIPNQSPLFDPEWKTNGHLDAAVKLLSDWVKTQNVSGLNMEIIKEENRTPLIFITVDGTNGTNETTLLYGHLDKQPPMTEYWEPGLGPFKPVVRDGKLYGRGGADDGYAIFAAISGIKALQLQNCPHPRCVVIIEACEESGSPDLPFYIDKLTPRIGTPSLIICLDSGCGNYEQMWLTTSLRGVLVGDVSVSITTEGVHSGASSGIIPSTSRIMRLILDRLEDTKTGKLHESLYCDIPEKHINYAKESAATLGKMVYSEFPFLPGVQPVTTDHAELCLNRTWRPTLTLTGQSGIPSLESAGNVMRTNTTFKLSIRLPPTLNPKGPIEALRKTVESNPPFGAHVKFSCNKSAEGWAAPDMAPWLEETVQEASQAFFQKPARFQGEGGSIPFMGMLGKKFPGVQFVITGVLGPKSNAHGPNEFLHINMCKNIMCSVAFILSKQYQVKVN